MTEINKCSICGQTVVGYGNNARPVNGGRCCDECNDTVVIPARIMQIVDVVTPDRTATKEDD